MDSLLYSSLCKIYTFIQSNYMLLRFSQWLRKDEGNQHFMPNMQITERNRSSISIWKPKTKKRERKFDLRIRTNAINLLQFEILDAEILLRCSKGKALGSLRMMISTIIVIVIIIIGWGSGALKPHLGIEFVLHCINLWCISFFPHQC